MVSWATKNGWIEKDPFMHYQLKLKRTERDYLSADEMSLIENYDFTNVMLQKVRDLFISSWWG
jgi:integrase/recombinase XerD